MRIPFYAIAAAAILMAVGAVPTGVSAQGVTIEGPGVGVRVGRDRDDWRERRVYRERNTYGVSRGERCRSVTIRERMPDGSLVVRKKRTCD
jgi:hypothetical protein